MPSFPSPLMILQTLYLIPTRRRVCQKRCGHFPTFRMLTTRRSKLYVGLGKCLLERMSLLYTKVMDTGITRRLVELLMHPSVLVETPALRVIGNFVTANEIITETVLKNGVLQRLKTLIRSPRKAVRKEVCWTLSNITAGTRQQIQASSCLSPRCYVWLPICMSWSCAVQEINNTPPDAFHLISYIRL